MTALAKGIAHISFVGGGTFLPARNPYDRETLVEYVADRVHTRGHVQVLVDGQRWMVCPRNPSVSSCATCRHSLDCRCVATIDRGAAYCLTCAFGNDSASGRCDEECRKCAN
jgi:hypothetical protein